MDGLPDEVWASEILWRLPVKSIQECMCVCKSWYSLITNSNFISIYNRNNSTKTKIFMHENNNGNCVFHFDNDDNYRRRLFRPCNGSPWNDMVGTVNGLICISIGRGNVNHIFRFILFNPSIGRVHSIPPPFPPPPKHKQYSTTISGSTVKGLGFDETRNDYKILYILSENYFVYSFNSNCWTRLIMNTPSRPHLSNSYHDVHSNSVVFVNGGIHWIVFDSSSNSNFIMVFDVKTEIFSQIQLPECLANSVHDHDMRYYSMVEYGESTTIAVINEQTRMSRMENVITHIWAMKEYGSTESWFKLATINSLEVSKVMGFINNDKVLITSGFIYSQNIHDKEEVKILMGYSDTNFSRVFKYVTSLVLLDKQNNIDAVFKD